MCEYCKNIKEEEPVAVKSDSTSLVSTWLNQNLFQFAINEKTTF